MTLVINKEFSKEMAGLFSDTPGCPQAFLTWLETEQLWQPYELGMLCKAEEEVERNILAQMPPQEPPLTRKEKVAIARNGNLHVMRALVKDGLHGEIIFGARGEPMYPGQGFQR